MSDIVRAMRWRFAAKAFDPEKKLDAAQLSALKEALRLSPTSYGFPAYNVAVVSNPELLGRLAEASFNQAQIPTCSHLFVFCNKFRPGDEEVEAYYQTVSEQRNVPPEMLVGATENLKKLFSGFTDEQSRGWTAHQAYLGLGVLLSACALEEVDACPMGGFEKSKYNEILRLEERGLTAEVLAAVGFRAGGECERTERKIRPAGEDFYIEFA